VVSEGRGDKILVFHFKRKKQYKKLQGHRQAYTAVRINSIEVNGFTYDKAEASAAR
jgi:large subunit ribosomal protein L21